VYANVNKPIASTTGDYAITTASGASEIALAQHLNKVGAKMYGAFTCPHCQNQKHLFGQEAADRLYFHLVSPTKNALPQIYFSQNMCIQPTNTFLYSLLKSRQLPIS